LSRPRVPQKWNRFCDRDALRGFGLAPPWAAAFACLLLGACITSHPPPLAPAPLPRPPVAGHVSSLAQLPGWDLEDHAAAFAAIRAGCGAARDPAFVRLCAEARAAGPLREREARDFLERTLTAEPADGEGLLTGYFAPRYEARSRPDDEFSAPVRPRPADPALAALSRAEIDARPAHDALAWMRPEDLFFLQIQGGGVLIFRDGERAS
jgi:membrane-bound lytic murein transglycosylase A